MTKHRFFLFIFVLSLLTFPASAANDTSSYNQTVLIENDTSVLSSEWYLDVIPAFEIAFSPDSEIISSRLDRPPEFRTNVSEISDVLWYIGDELIGNYSDVNNSSYTPNLSETGNYSIKVNVSNNNGTIWNQWYWVATPTPSQIISGGSGSRSSSSSDSVLSGEDYDNIILKDVRMQVVNKGTRTSYSFSDEKNPVDSLAFRSSVNAGYVKATIEVLNNRSTSITKSPGDDIYSYMNINLGKRGLENKLSDTRIVFHIDREWLNENDIDTDSIRLNVFGGSNWKVFPVKVINESDKNVTFVSTTTEFGSFSITGQSNESPDNDIIVIDMSGNAMNDPSVGSGSHGSMTENSKESQNEDLLSSVLRSMTELFIKRNPVDN